MKIGRDIKTHKILECKTVKMEDGTLADCKNCSNKERCAVPKRDKEILRKFNKLLTR